MSLFESRISRRTLGGLTMGVAATGSLAYLVSAQDAATPAAVDATPEVAGVPSLAELENATHIDVKVLNGAYAAYVGNGQEEGWYVFNVENTSEADASFNLALLPEGTTASDLSGFVHQVNVGEATEMPEWLSGTTFAGGTSVPVGETASVLVKLVPGEWTMFSTNAQSKQGPANFKVLNADELLELYGVEAAATPEGGSLYPEGFSSSFTISISDAGIGADAMPAQGLNIIGVRNDGTAPADLVILHGAEAGDPAQLAEIAKAYIAGEETDYTLVGGMGALSPGNYGYIELTAESGVYLAFSSLVNASGTPQVDDGVLIAVPM